MSAGPTASASAAMTKIAPARAAAFAILTLIGEGKGHSDDLLHSAHIAALSPDDRNLATALVMGVLRWQIALDARLSKLLARPDQSLAEPVAFALRLGAFQLLHMDRIPAHAALSESVEMCRAAGQPHAAGMVNAVLRKLAAAQRPGTRIFESTAAFAERLAHPLWLVERWVAAYGRDAALAICEYDQQEPRAGGLFVDDRVEERSDSISAGSPAPEPLPQIDDGSRLVAELAATAAPEVDGRVLRVWDCCAAPGGKTLLLALRLRDAEIVASDISAKRLAQTAARLRRYAYAERVRCFVADVAVSVADAAPSELNLKAQRNAELEGEFDLILCDVPCSGTGTLARNPEIRLRLQPAELERQAMRQRAILAGALARLAPGGRLVYSTCSLEPEENQRVVEAVMAEAVPSQVGLRVAPVGPRLEMLAAEGILQPEVATNLIDSATHDGALRTLPGVHACDGFFASVLERV